MSVSFWQDKIKNISSMNPIAADVIIIGGGIAGLSTAYWLQKEDPNLKISLLEKNHLGDGATGRNAGFITCGSVEHFNRLVGKHGIEEASQIWKFSEENLALLKDEIINDSKSELFFENKGSFSLASAKNEFCELKESAKIMKEMGIEVEVLAESDVKRRLGANEFVGGIKYCGDSSVDPHALLMAIKNKIEFRNKNVKFFEHNEVYSIESKGGVKLIKTNKHHFESPVVVMATNGYSPLLNSFFNDKIFPTRGQILLTERVPRFMEGPCYANFVLDYFRQLPTGEMLIGGFRQLKKDTELGYSDEISPVIQNALEEFLNKHIPNVKKTKVTHRWSGIMGFSVDGQPMVGALPTDNQLFFVGGFTAHGLGLAFHCGKALVDSFYERPIPSFISAKRFN